MGLVARVILVMSGGWMAWGMDWRWNGEEKKKEERRKKKLTVVSRDCEKLCKDK